MARAIFFGTPAFAVPCLRTTAELADVRLVVTQPDRPAGRGQRLSPSSVKQEAGRLGLRVETPTKLRSEAFVSLVRETNADIAVVVAYGRILPRPVFSAPRKGSINVHASLLPRWRGAAPIQWAVLQGETETGVTLMQLDEGMDTGPMLSSLATPIGEEESAGELAERLAAMGAELLARDLPRVLRGEMVAHPQDPTSATPAPPFEKEDGQIDWTQSARAVHNRVRAMTPSPGAFTWKDHVRVRIHRTRIVQDTGCAALSGALMLPGRAALHVACGTGIVAIEELQLQGRKRLRAEQFLTGAGWRSGERLGQHEDLHEDRR